MLNDSYLNRTKVPTNLFGFVNQHYFCIGTRPKHCSSSKLLFIALETLVHLKNTRSIFLFRCWLILKLWKADSVTDQLGSYELRKFPRIKVLWVLFELININFEMIIFFFQETLLLHPSFKETRSYLQNAPYWCNYYLRSSKIHHQPKMHHGEFLEFTKIPGNWSKRLYCSWWCWLNTYLDRWRLKN